MQHISAGLLLVNTEQHSNIDIECTAAGFNISHTRSLGFGQSAFKAYVPASQYISAAYSGQVIAGTCCSCIGASTHCCNWGSIGVGGKPTGVALLTGSLASTFCFRCRVENLELPPGINTGAAKRLCCCC